MWFHMHSFVRLRLAVFLMLVECGTDSLPAIARKQISKSTKMLNDVMESWTLSRNAQTHFCLNTGRCLKRAANSKCVNTKRSDSLLMSAELCPLPIQPMTGYLLCIIIIIIIIQHWSSSQLGSSSGTSRLQHCLVGIILWGKSLILIVCITWK